MRIKLIIQWTWILFICFNYKTEYLLPADNFLRDCIFVEISVEERILYSTFL